MSVEENMALARRFLETHFKGDLDAMDKMMTPASLLMNPVRSMTVATLREIRRPRSHGDPPE